MWLCSTLRRLSSRFLLQQGGWWQWRRRFSVCWKRKWWEFRKALKLHCWGRLWPWQWGRRRQLVRWRGVVLPCDRSDTSEQPWQLSEWPWEDGFPWSIKSLKYFIVQNKATVSLQLQYGQKSLVDCIIKWHLIMTAFSFLHSGLQSCIENNYLVIDSNCVPRFSLCVVEKRTCFCWMFYGSQGMGSWLGWYLWFRTEELFYLFAGFYLFCWLFVFWQLSVFCCSCEGCMSQISFAFTIWGNW